MKNITTHHYVNPVLESKIEKLESELTTFAEVQGRQNGIENMPQTEDEFKILALNKIESQVKHCIEELNADTQVSTGMVLAQKIDQDAKDKKQPLTGNLNDCEHDSRKFEEQKRLLRPTTKEQIMRWVVNTGLFLIALAEGFFAFEATRNSGLSFKLSLVSFFAVFITVGLVTHVVVSYIKRLQKRVHKILALIGVSCIAFIGFYFLGTLRADAYGAVQSMDLSVTDHKPFTTGISGFKLTIISFILFEAGLFLSYFYGKSQAQIERDKQYDSACRSFSACKKKMKKLSSQIQEIEKATHQETESALLKYEYILYTKKRLTAMANHIAQKYIETNIRHRADRSIPIFFTHPAKFNF